MLPLLLEGSVKNIYGIKNQAPYEFDFSNRYSIFDWGKMPDELEDKGKALAYIAWFFFDFLEDKKNWETWSCEDESLKNKLLDFKKEGVKHHCLGRVLENGKQTSRLKVEPVNVLHPTFQEGKWDYSKFKTSPEKALIPLEFIFRFGVPKGSSLMKRVDNANYLLELGLTEKPKFGDKFSTPVVEFSTKLETTDRYIDYAQAKEIANLTNGELTDLLATIKLIALRLKDLFQENSLELWDGKFELAFGDKKKNGDRELIMIDSIGPDELRLTRNGVSLSKENLRSFYREGAWHLALEESKTIAKNRKEKDWKSICLKEMDKKPENLNTEFKEHAEGIYTGLANLLSQKQIFEKSKSLDDVVNFFKGEL